MLFTYFSHENSWARESPLVDKVFLKPESFNNFKMVEAKMTGSPGGTIKPACPRVAFYSPTSVATTGQPHDIASKITLGRPSEIELETKTVESRIASRITSGDL